MHHLKKRVCAAMLAGLMSCFAFAAPVKAVTAEPVSDRNGDGVVDVFDYILAKRETVEQSNYAEIAAEAVSAPAGGTAALVFNLSVNPGITGMSFMLTYDPALSLSAVDCDLPLLSEQAPYYAAYPTAGLLNFYTAEQSLVKGAGEFMYLMLQIPEDAVPGTEYEVRLRGISMQDKNGANLECGASIGRISVNDEEYVPPVTSTRLPVTETTTTTTETTTTTQTELTTTTTTTTTTTATTKPFTPQGGIDISQWQGTVNFTSVKNAGTKFAILRAGYGRYASQVDKKFVEYYNGAKAAGIPLGAYWYSYAKSVDEARLEAKACIQVLGGRTFEYPIAFDIEESSQFKLGKETVSAMIAAFCDELEAAGYYAAVYSYASAFQYYINDYVKSRYDVWVAHYNVSKPSFSGTYGMWQYSSTGKVSGINGNVDQDYAYRDYPYIIKTYHLNNF